MDTANNKTTLEITGMAWANSLLENSIEWINTFGENDFLKGGKLSDQACATLVVGHAIIQQQERMAILLTERLENIENSINDLASCFSKLDENLVYVRGIKEQLEYLVDSIDCAGAKPTEFWIFSEIAAIDKANELGIKILPEYSFADLKYKIHCAIQEAV